MITHRFQKENERKIYRPLLSSGIKKYKTETFRLNQILVDNLLK